MDKLTPSEKRKLKNAKYYAKKRDEKGKEAKTSYENLKLENKQLKETIKKILQEIDNLKKANEVIDWSDED
tara:strand:- start:1096 stop:1308 length:213 start_codon:yes stop_codon:yes gene_type:complete